MLLNHLDRGQGMGKIRIPGFPQRGRHTDIHRVKLCDDAEVGHGLELLLLDPPSNLMRLNVRGMGHPTVQLLHTFSVRIDADYPKTCFGELHGERESDTPQPDNTHPRCFPDDLL